jgi:branched-chain amino acid transport system ATP-binding protein
MSDSLLDLDGVSAGYAGRPVLREISLSVQSGLVVVILGPNGHGKTTLLRCISGLVKPTAGIIRFDGKTLNRHSSEKIVKLGIAHVPQGDLLFPEMSVRDNLLMGAYLCASAEDRQNRLEKIYALLPKLKERWEQMANSLSGGERRMLAIGRGLMTQGRLMLLDEPSLGLAPVMIDQIYAVINNLKAQGKTIVLVEEHPKRAFEVADLVYLLEDGRIIWQGKPEEMTGRQKMLDAYLGG